MDDPPRITPEQRRAAEERLRTRYEAELTKTIELEAREALPWPVGPGPAQVTEARIGAHVEEVRLEGFYPDTRVVIVFRHQRRPGDRIGCRFRVWPQDPPDDAAEPPYNDVLWVNLDEWISAHLRRAPALADDELAPDPLSSRDA